MYENFWIFIRLKYSSDEKYFCETMNIFDQKGGLHEKYYYGGKIPGCCPKLQIRVIYIAHNRVLTYLSTIGSNERIKKCDTLHLKSQSTTQSTGLIISQDLCSSFIALNYL